MTSPKWLLVSHASQTQIKRIFLRTESLKRTQVFEREVVVNVTKELVNKSQKTVWMSLMTPVWETSKDNENVKVKSFSRVWLSATPWTAAHQAPPSTGFSRQEYSSGVPLPLGPLWIMLLWTFLGKSCTGTCFHFSCADSISKITDPRTSLEVHWLRRCASTKVGTGSVPSWGTKSCMPHSAPLKIYKLLVHVVTLCLTFWGTTIMVSKVTIPLYILTNNIWELFDLSWYYCKRHHCTYKEIIYWSCIQKPY